MQNKTCCNNPKLTTHRDKSGNWVRWCSKCGAETEMEDVKVMLQKLINNYLSINQISNL